MSSTLSQQRTRCEVWTRVMGYHRPVSHFNKGKKSEFYSRTYFKESDTNQRFIERYSTQAENARSEETRSNHNLSSYLLFTTSTCQKCPAIKAWVQEHLSHLDGLSVSNLDHTFFELAEKNEVLTAPTLIFFDTEGKELFRGDDLSTIAPYFAPFEQCVSLA